MAKKKPAREPDPISPGIIREEIGSGITKKTRTRIIGPFNDQGLALLKRTFALVNNPFAEIEPTLRNHLRKAGLPDDPTEGGKYPHRSHITAELAEKAYQSDDWYIAAILDEISAWRWALEVRDGRGAAAAEGRARYLYRERHVKSEYDKPVEIGKRKQRVQAELANRKHEKYRPANEAKKQRWQSAANEVWAKNMVLSPFDVAKRIKQKLKLNVTADWIRKNIKKPTA